MYNIINKSNDFFVYVASKNKHTHIGDENALINYLLNHCSSSWSGFYNSCFSELDLTGKDKTLTYRVEKIKTVDEFGDEVITDKRVDYFIPKEYLFYDGYDRIVDIRIYRKEVERLHKKNLNKRSYWEKKRKDNYEVGESYIKRSHWRGYNLYYKYRRGPVSGTGIIRGGYKKYHRHPKINSIRKELSNPEYKDYIRKKSIPTNLHGWWDDNPPRHFEKSWKSQTKCRHQWQKNLRN